MRCTVKNAVTLTLAALFYQQTCLAQADPWEHIKVIEQGSKVSVKLQSGKTVNGKMGVWSTDGISVRRGKTVVPIAKPDVARVALVIGRSRGRKAMLAALIAGGIVGGLGGGACAAGGGCGSFEAAMTAISAAFCGGIAAGIAALFPPATVPYYSAPPGTPPGAGVSPKK